MGGKKKGWKKKNKPTRNNLEPLQKQFDCPFCNHEKSCEVRLDRARNTGKIGCRICMEVFQAVIHNLSEPIDVFNDWVDACEAAN